MTDRVDPRAPGMGAVHFDTRPIAWMASRTCLTSVGYPRSRSCQRRLLREPFFGRGNGAVNHRTGAPRARRGATDLRVRCGTTARLVLGAGQSGRAWLQFIYSPTCMAATVSFIRRCTPSRASRWHRSACTSTRFICFALHAWRVARGRASRPGTARLSGDTALRCLEQLRERLGKQSGGFEESAPPSLPLKSNPHMHLLEAALAWIEVSEGAARTPWIALATEIVGLCLTYFVDANTGAVGEYFDYDWGPGRRRLGDGWSNPAISSSGHGCCLSGCRRVWSIPPHVRPA